MNEMIWHGMLIAMLLLGAVGYFTTVLFAAFRVKTVWVKVAAWLMYFYTMYVVTLHL